MQRKALTLNSLSDTAMALTREVPSRKSDAKTHIGPTPLVGRSHLLDSLCGPHNTATILFGEPGIGKTRLLAEARLRLQDAAGAFYVACLPGSEHLPLDAFIALMKTLRQHGRISGDALRAIMDADERDRLWHIREALESAAAEGPLTLQIDDLQWADRDTTNALRHCIDRLRSLPVRWHLAARSGNSAVDEMTATLGRKALAKTLQLEGLAPDETSQLARSLLPDDRLDDASVANLFERTAGNPLYVELLIQGGTWASRELAPDLKRTLRERLGTLSLTAGKIAGWMAVHGGSLTEPDLAALTKYSPGRIAQGLSELRVAQIIRNTAEGYSFRHALLRDACYEDLDDRVRLQHHITFAARSTDDWERGAHLDGAGRYAEAAILYNRVGWDRLDRHAPKEALAAFTRAHERAELHSETGWEARAGLAAALCSLGSCDAADAAMRAFEDAAPTLPVALRVLARGRYAEAAWERAQDYKVALPYVESAIADAQTAVPTMLPRLLCVLGAAYERLGELEKARATLERGLACCDESKDPRQAIRLRAWRATVMGRLGKPKDGIAELEAVVRQAVALRLGNEVAQCCAKLCYLCDMLADYEAYEYWCRFGLDAPGSKSNSLRSLLLSNLSSVAIGKGRLQEALDVIIAAADAVDASNATYLCRALCAQAQLHTMLGSPEKALATLREAVRLDLQPTWHRAVAFTAGFVDELRGDDASALPHFRRALINEPVDARREVYEMRALVGIVRVACRRREKKLAAWALKQLQATARHGWDVARTLVNEATGYWELSRGHAAKGAGLLLEAAANQDPFWAARLKLAVADALASRGLFLEAIDAFDSMEAHDAGDEARARARAHGMRPGRKREARGQLSAREASVAMLIANGKTNAEIGRLLHITARTVEYHVGNILAKCDLRSRVEIATALTSGQLAVGASGG